MTGAPLPAGADAVVMVEDSELLDREKVRLTAAVAAGTSVRAVGDDVRSGDVVFRAGTVVTPAVLGVLASINATSLRAYPRARVAVMSTGDELVTDGSPLAPGQIRETNQTMLAPLLAAAGCAVRTFGVVPDDEPTLERTLREAAESSDAIVTSGGVSMGDYDVVKAVLGRIAEMHWMQIAIKPAKPFAFGIIDGVPVFGLPGNPVSSLVSFELLARPALRRMMGHRDPFRPTVPAVADGGLRRRPDGKVHLIRVVATFAADGRLHVDAGFRPGKPSAGGDRTGQRPGGRRRRRRHPGGWRGTHDPPDVALAQHPSGCCSECQCRYAPHQSVGSKRLSRRFATSSGRGGRSRPG